MTLSALDIVLLLAAGLFGGAINVMAAGGSVITVPVMIMLGVPGPIANGSNRIAIIAQNIAATRTFFSRGVRDLRLSITLAIATLPGVIYGAWLGAELDAQYFNYLLTGVMVTVLFFVWRPVPTIKSGNQAMSSSQWWAGHLLMAVIGFWGGIIHIGIGFLMMPILNRVMGLDLITTNMHKCLIVLLYTVIALGVFAYHGEVYWLIGIVLAIGNTIGGHLGARWTMRLSEATLRKIIVAAILLLIAKLLLFP